MPETDAEGFLPLGSEEEFVYEDVEGGLWIYLSDELSVHIESYQHGYVGSYREHIMKDQRKYQCDQHSEGVKK